jgi:hypothetical protein
MSAASATTMRSTSDGDDRQTGEVVGYGRLATRRFLPGHGEGVTVTIAATTSRWTAFSPNSRSVDVANGENSTGSRSAAAS